ncbi:NAD(P)-binding domain-containing protein, partial [Rhizobium brockwellii]|uniref:NAD(P)-binding domain-containing protein n=1 Tax=Rhizobium brockwellii TaxID=3019932 RepID=UPI003F9CE6F9
SPLAENSGSAVVAAVIGLGSMGLGMARSIKRAGLDVVGYDNTPAAVDRFVADGGRGAATPVDAAKDADIFVSVVDN